MKYRLVITIANGFNVDELHQVEGDSLVELTSKIPLVIAQVYQKELEKKIQEIREEFRNDDIPF